VLQQAQAPAPQAAAASSTAAAAAAALSSSPPSRSSRLSPAKSEVEEGKVHESLFAENEDLIVSRRAEAQSSRGERSVTNVEKFFCVCDVCVLSWMFVVHKSA
jgi:hypothetical protein